MDQPTNDKIQPWETRNSKMAFDHRWFKVRQDEVKLPNGTILDDFFVWEKGDVAAVVPVTADGNFILVRQYKHGVGQIIMEVPAGFVDKGEDPKQAAHRELREETGYQSDNLELLAALSDNPTKATGTTYVYLAQNAVKKHDTHFDDNEEIETLVKTPQEFLELMTSGKLYATGSVAAGMLALAKLGLLTPKN